MAMAAAIVQSQIQWPSDDQLSFDDLELAESVVVVWRPRARDEESTDAGSERSELASVGSSADADSLWLPKETGGEQQPCDIELAPGQDPVNRCPGKMYTCVPMLR
mmetsp:Transcript_96755/g.270831  ORF Transcript_96755/g.270831 Transcript_96755/m.270831 type:complete len:106 (+) Transcript_96755:83-400(+)